MAHLLETNNAPTEAQISDLRRARSEGVRRAAELKSLISDASSTLKALLCERREIRWKIQHHDVVLNPVRRLPSEILQEIFLHVYDGTPSNTTHLVPIGVCRSWFYAATSFPRLWTTIRISADNGFPLDEEEREYFNRSLFSLSVSLRRSANLPLYISLDLDGDEFSYSGYALPWLFSIAGRIKCLELTDVRIESILAKTEFTHLMSSCSILETFVLRHATGREVDLAVGNVRLPLTVRHLSIDAYPYLSHPSVDLNWSSVEHVELGIDSTSCPESIITPTSVLNTLSRLTAAHSLRLVDHGVLERQILPTSTSHGTVTLPAIHTLSLSTRGKVTDTILDQVLIPCLENLILDGAPVYFTSVPRIRALLRRSRCEITTMIILSPDAPLGFEAEPILQNLLQSDNCRNLKELSILDIRFINHTDIFEMLNIISRDPAFLPSLRRLEIDVSRHPRGRTPSPQTDPLSEFMASFLVALEARCTSSSRRARLDSITLHARSNQIFSQDYQDRINVLRRAGMKIYICLYADSDPRPF